MTDHVDDDDGQAEANAVLERLSVPQQPLTADFSCSASPPAIQ
jgi:hypothetical protein